MKTASAFVFAWIYAAGAIAPTDQATGRYAVGIVTAGAIGYVLAWLALNFKVMFTSPPRNPRQP